jgi:hypothetical protein
LRRNHPQQGKPAGDPDGFSPLSNGTPASLSQCPEDIFDRVYARDIGKEAQARIQERASG